MLPPMNLSLEKVPPRNPNKRLTQESHEGWTHPTMTREQFSARLAELYVEGGTEFHWFYISFVGDGRFLGGVYLEAWHKADAIVRSHELGLNPGGEAAIWEIPDTRIFQEIVPAKDRYRLLSKEEINP